MINEKQGRQLSKLLCHFLKEKGLYAKFSHYYRKYVKMDNKRLSFITISDIPFEKTKEGKLFWEQVNLDFMYYIVKEYKTHVSENREPKTKLGKAIKAFRKSWSEE
jgi:hypothetical protein